MKRITMFFILALAVLATGSGCTSIKNLEGFVPPITAQEVSYTRTGKFSSTTIHVSNLRKEGDLVKADEITLKHSDVYIPNVDITIKGYQRQIVPAAAEAPASVK